jgi:acyl carrier protein
MQELEREIQELIVTALALEDITPDEIIVDEPLFGAGLGLDSIDALELGIAIQKKYQVRIDAAANDTREHFKSVRNLARFVAKSRVKQD